MDHIKKTAAYLHCVGNTPLIMLATDIPNINLFAKLESCNPTGSVKDRAANHVLRKILALKQIDEDTTIIESSSGNFALSLSAYCRLFNLRFICVVDCKISAVNETRIEANRARIVKITEPDEYGGYVINRIRKVKDLCNEIPNSYFVNQYENVYVAEAYSRSLGEEVCRHFKSLDYIFVAVSSGGTITGISNRLKERFPGIKVVAVDIVGSRIFGQPAAPRNIPGIGSSIIPNLLKKALIDEVIIIDEVTTIRGCYSLLSSHQLFVGGSSGLVYEAVGKYFEKYPATRSRNVLAIFPDGGERYVETIYNKDWCERICELNLNVAT